MADSETAQHPEDHGGAGARAQPVADGHRLSGPLAELIRLAGQVAEGRVAGVVDPAWRRRTRGEHRWPVTASIVAAIVLQILLSDTLNKPLPHYLLPSLEVALGIGLSIANPVRIERGGTVVRAASIALIVLISAANAVSAILLVRAILETLPSTAHAGPLLTSGASIWATNVIAFGLWYWEFDRGGPVRRAEGTAQHPDLMFPQMASPELAPPDWEPYFVDYLYLSFTNATAFSPTDVMPLARWAKMTMAVQSAVSLLVGALVIARAVNIL
ncbi:MAG TPA: hypothetical protein VMI33_23390 [Streptosporangiaceae bacterium]|nr:hypothetical protein [Streptosporangiaceae bacterium]